MLVKNLIDEGKSEHYRNLSCQSSDFLEDINDH
jgi:hypothetical protein